MLAKWLEQDRKRAGPSLGRVAWELGVIVREDRELEAGERRRALRHGTGSVDDHRAIDMRAGDP